jgi:IS5 family transposase
MPQYFPYKIKYPNDVSLLNDIREWLVKHIDVIRKKIGKKVRTKRRVARKVYLNFAKKKRKTKKTIKKAKREMLQFVRRNIKQLNELIKGAKKEPCKKKSAKLELARNIFNQQYEMYRANKNRIKNRIISFHRGYVRPIKRGKSGKPVEFGPKGALSLIGGFLFLDNFSHDNFSEAQEDIVREQIKNYKEKFKKKPPSFTGDKLYGTLKNREIVKEEKIRGSFVALGKKSKRKTADKQWFKKKQKERNRIEGAFGNGKEHYGLDKVLYQGIEGSERWARSCILGMNLKTALARI